jgi:hypothetical protein
VEIEGFKDGGKKSLGCIPDRHILFLFIPLILFASALGLLLPFQEK